MRILSRIVIVLLVLGGLGFGSYSFGQHVLSSRLFGSSVVPNASSSFSAVEPSRGVTRKTEYKGSAPHVEVEVLDADSAGPGPEAPSLENLRKSSSGGASVQQELPTGTIKRGKPRRFDAPDAAGFRGSREVRGRDDDEEDRPVRRRRRRVRTNSERTTRNTARETIARRDTSDSNESSRDSDRSSDSGATVLPESGPSSSSGERSVERSRSNDSSNDSGRSVSSGSSSSSREERPTRRRRRRVRSSSGSSSSRERSTPRAPRESPVPVAEDSGGGDSPVPQPE